MGPGHIQIADLGKMEGSWVIEESTEPCFSYFFLYYVLSSPPVKEDMPVPHVFRT
jgi:hypothetical protein